MKTSLLLLALVAFAPRAATAAPAPPVPSADPRTVIVPAAHAGGAGLSLAGSF